MINDGTVLVGYNDVPSVKSFDSRDVFTYTAKPIRRPLMTLAEEYLRAATQIASVARQERKNVAVLYSGGIDSEAVLEAFNRIPDVPGLTAVMIRFEDDLNLHELKAAEDYLFRRPRIARKYIDIKIRDWLRSFECRDYAAQAQTPELGYTHLFKVIKEDLKKSLVVLGFDEPMVWADDSQGKRRWIFHRHERHYSMRKFMVAEKIIGVPHFTHWSTELMNAYLVNDFFAALYANVYNPAIWQSELLKYGLWWSQFGLAERVKFHSFEKLANEILDADEKWKAEQPVQWTRSCNTEIFEWLRSCKVIAP